MIVCSECKSMVWLDEDGNTPEKCSDCDVSLTTSNVDNAGAKPDIIITGEKGIRKALLSEETLTELKNDLVVMSRAYQDNPSIAVRCYREDDEYIWMPRYFERDYLLANNVEDRTVEGEKAQVDFKLTLLPERGQPLAYKKMVAHLKKYQSGILKAHTGFGKSFCGYAIASAFQKKIGVLVYNSHMLDNWLESAKKAFDLSDSDIGIVQGDRCDLGKPITIMMIQSLLARKYPKNLYSQFGIIISDESQRYAADSWGKVAAMFPAKHRLGLSATPYRADGLDSIIFWNFGEIAHEVVKKDGLEKPKVIQILYKHTYHWRKYCRWIKNSETGEYEPDVEWVKDVNGIEHPVLEMINVQRYRKLLAKDDRRNKIIIREMVNACKKGRKILIMSHFRDHLTALKKLFDVELSNFPNTSVSMLVGGIKNLEEAMSADIIFTTYSFSREGLNLPHIDTLFMVTPTGNPTQPLGRLRDTGPDKCPLLALDFYEDTKYAKDRAASRRDTYEYLGVKVSIFERV